MTNITLTQDLVKHLFDYRDNGTLFWKNKTSIYSNVPIGIEAGCLFIHKAGNRYMMSIFGKRYLRSRIVFLYHKGYMPIVVDHENHITTDDRIKNLRAASKAENCRNKSSQVGSTSKYLGVSYDNVNKTWRARIWIKSMSKNINAGSFKCENKAALEYNKLAVKHHGEFANLNIVRGGE